MESYTNSIIAILNRYEINLIFRIVVACLCGVAIGFERKSRAKEAGIRTHCIVACASAMMMVVSKYGFGDLISGGFPADVRLDPSRMAQGIVTGVGFLGSGMIYHQRGSTKGLTTAAGVWATSGIGMALGAGMYIIGIASTLIILIVQYVLHTKNKFTMSYKSKTLKISGVSEEGYQKKVITRLSDMGIATLDTSVGKDNNGECEYSFYLEIPGDIDEEELVRGFEYKCSLNFTH